jgi:hypothetical protein
MHFPTRGVVFLIAVFWTFVLGGLQRTSLPASDSTHSYLVPDTQSGPLSSRPTTDPDGTSVAHLSPCEQA